MAHTDDARERRFHDLLERLALALGHADRREPLRAYLTGLCLPGDRKSIEPMAARRLPNPREILGRWEGEWSMPLLVPLAQRDGSAPVLTGGGSGTVDAPYYQGIRQSIVTLEMECVR